MIEIGKYYVVSPRSFIIIDDCNQFKSINCPFATVLQIVDIKYCEENKYKKVYFRLEYNKDLGFCKYINNSFKPVALHAMILKKWILFELDDDYLEKYKKLYMDIKIIKTYNNIMLRIDQINEMTIKHHNYLKDHKLYNQELRTLFCI